MGRIAGEPGETGVSVSLVDREPGDVHGELSPDGGDVVEDPERRIAQPLDGGMVDGRHEGRAMGEGDDAGGDRTPLGLVLVEDALVGAVAEHAGEPGRERDGVLDAGVHALAARRAVHVRRVAGEEDAAVAVVVGEPVVDAKSRAPYDVVHVRGALVGAALVQ